MDISLITSSVSAGDPDAGRGLPASSRVMENERDATTDTMQMDVDNLDPNLVNEVEDAHDATEETNSKRDRRPTTRFSAEDDASIAKKLSNRGGKPLAECWRILAQEENRHSNTSYRKYYTRNKDKLQRLARTINPNTPEAANVLDTSGGS